MSAAQVEPQVVEERVESPDTKEFQEKYYPILPSSVNKYDVYSVGSAIDDEISKFLENRDFKSNNTYLDLKILLLAVACGLGYVSHFVLKFPRDANEVGLCLLGYGVVMALHYYIETYCEKDAFFISKSHNFDKFKSFEQTAWYSKVVVADDQLSATYELKVDATSKAGKKVSVTGEYCISKVIDNKGYFHIRKANDFITEDIVEKLAKEIKKSA